MTGLPRLFVDQSSLKSRVLSSNLIACLSTAILIGALNSNSSMSVSVDALRQVKSARRTYLCALSSWPPGNESHFAKKERKEKDGFDG